MEKKNQSTSGFEFWMFLVTDHFPSRSKNLIYYLLSSIVMKMELILSTSRDVRCSPKVPSCPTPHGGTCITSPIRYILKSGIFKWETLIHLHTSKPSTGLVPEQGSGLSVYFPFFLSRTQHLPSYYSASSQLLCPQGTLEILQSQNLDP